MSLKIEVIRKIYKNRKLVGYEVRDEAGNAMSIDKDAVKHAIQSGKVEVLNMTVTSDGRLLGAAKPLNKKNNTSEIEYKLVEVYTHGHNFVGALVDESSAVDAGIIDSNDIAGMSHGHNFETASTVVDRMLNNVYSNLTIYDNEVNSDIARVNFADVLGNMIKILRANNVLFTPDDFKVQHDFEGGQLNILNPVSDETNNKVRRIVILIITYRLYDIGVEINSVNDSVINVRKPELNDDELLSAIIEVFK